MLTQKDLDEIEQLIEEKIKFLPTKDEFYTEMGKIMKELQSLRQETLENIHPQGKHSQVSS